MWPLLRRAPAAKRPAADPWVSGYALEGWDRIAALQRYPILDENPPDWQAVSRDKDPLVRTAAAMAMARTAGCRAHPGAASDADG